MSIPALVKAAWLTHGGFYAHFENRDELVSEAVLAAAHETAARVLSPETGDLDPTRDAYLSIGHVEHPEVGCVIAALGTEGRARSKPGSRLVFHDERGGKKMDCAIPGTTGSGAYVLSRFRGGSRGAVEREEASPPSVATDAFGRRG